MLPRGDKKAGWVRLFSTGIILLIKQYLKPTAVTLSAVKRGEGKGRGGADFTNKNSNPLAPSFSPLEREEGVISLWYPCSGAPPCYSRLVRAFQPGWFLLQTYGMKGLI